jgi:hypothetical protein
MRMTTLRRLIAERSGAACAGGQAVSLVVRRQCLSRRRECQPTYHKALRHPRRALQRLLFSAHFEPGLSF